MLQENDYPISVQFNFDNGLFAPAMTNVNRHVSDMAKMFADKEAVEAEIKAGDKLVYDIAYHTFETSVSDMAMGVTRIHPGTVGSEYHMTKGHYHVKNEAEIYFCVSGEGYLLLQTRDGEFRAEPWTPGTITHIPPMWAHRAVNTGKEMLIYVASFHTSAGHDYGTIEQKGFVKKVVEQDGQAAFVDNELWK